MAAAWPRPIKFHSADLDDVFFGSFCACSPAALDRPGRVILPGRESGGPGRGWCHGEMTMVTAPEAARDNSLFGRIRQSSHCQQDSEEQSRAAFGGHGHHEKGLLTADSDSEFTR